MQLDQIQISVYPGINPKPKSTRSLAEVLGWIKNNYDNIAYLQDFIRAEKDKKKRDEFKKKLPSATFSGRFVKRHLDHLTEYSNIICIDIDGLTKAELKQLKQLIAGSKYTLAVFISPSGNGLKILIKVPGTKDDHYIVFAQIEKYFLAEFSVIIDPSGKDYSRLCFLAHDEEIYINEASEVFEMVAAEPVKAPPAHTVPLPKKAKKTFEPDSRDHVIYSMDLLFKCEEIARKKFSPTEGSLNQYIGSFANQCNRYAVDVESCISALSSYARPDHDEAEIRNEVEYIYKKNLSEHGKYNEKTNQTRTKESTNSTDKTMQRNQKNEEIADVLYDTKVVFWYSVEETNKTTGEVKTVYKFSYNKACEFLENNGFFKYYLSEGKYQLIRVDFKKHVVELVSELRIKEFMFDFLKSNGSDEYYEVREMFRRGVKMYANTNVFDGLEYFTPVFKRDTQTQSFAYFKNCFLEITNEGIIKRDYSEQEAFIWKKQIVDIEYKKVENNNCDFNRFITFAITGRKVPIEEYTEDEINKYKSMCSTIGYMLHSYKNPALTKAVIAVDRTKRMSSNESNGGTGKSLFSKAIGKMLNMTIIDGANFKFDYEFAFQQCNVDTALINFNDVNKNFDFTRLFGMITEEFSFSKKGKDAITLSFADSPKIFISTNQSMRGDGNSHSRRQQIIEFSDYFIKVDPVHEFGHRLFDDWSSDEWTAFYSFMVDCIQLFLENGLIDFPVENYEHNKLVDMAGEEFIDFMQEALYDDKGEMINWRDVQPKELHKKYIEVNKSKALTKLNTFNKYIKMWANVNGFEINAHVSFDEHGQRRDRRNGIDYLTFTPKNIE